MSSQNETRDKSVRLFTYLRELTQLKTKVTTDINEYEQVIWFNDIPKEKECICVAWGPSDDETSETWLEIKKPKRKDPPELPTNLKEWISIKQIKDSSKSPQLPVSIVTTYIIENESGDGIEQTIVIHLAEEPRIQKSWETYLAREWKPWAKDDQRLVGVEKIYKELFSIHQKQQKLGESFEVILGLGFFLYKASASSTVRRHILTTQAVVSFDSQKGVISVGPPADGTKLRLEQEMIEPQKRPDAQVCTALEKRAAEVGEELWDRVSVDSLLKDWTNSFSSDSRYEDTIIPQAKTVERPTVHFAPALILRKQNERNLLRVYEDIIDQLQNGTEVPLGVSKLVNFFESTDSASIQDNTETDSLSAVPIPKEEILFPLPANREQREIANRITSNQGVLVQGPPGTGKSHTIVNLVCHLLATGNRVLVTSHTQRALKVLQDKFPPELSALCVSLLGDDLNGMKALEDSVQGITEKYDNLNPEETASDIKTLEKQLLKTRAEIAHTSQQLKTVRESEIYKHPTMFNSYVGTLANIANQVRIGEERHSWFSEIPKKLEPFSLNNDEIAKVLRLSSSLTEPLEKQLLECFPSADEIILADKFEKMCELEQSAKSASDEKSQHRLHVQFSQLSSLQNKDREELLNKMKTVQDLLSEISRFPYGWLGRARTNIFGERDKVWREILTQTKQTILKLRKILSSIDDVTVEGVDGQNLQIVKVHAQALAFHFSQGKGLGFGPFKATAVKDGEYLIKNVKVSGRACDNLHSLSYLIKWIDLSEGLSQLRKTWQEFGELVVGSPKLQFAEFEGFCTPIELLLTSLDVIKQVRSKKLPEPKWHDDAEILAFRKALEAIYAEESFNITKKNLQSLQKAFQPSGHKKPHAIYQQLSLALAERNVEKYKLALSQLEVLYKAQSEQYQRESLLDKMSKSSVKLANQIRSRTDIKELESKIHDFESTWNWACAKKWLAEMTDPNLQESLIQSLNSLRKRELNVIKNLGAAKAWSYCFSRMNETQRSHLVAWSKAVKKIGKGTGKYANKHRKDAREHMEQCRTAIPAWIMPIHRVAETIKPGTDAFDVAIVDEASQSGPEALFLHYLAKKIVVVGDDKQISPESWLDKENVQVLREKWIGDIPFSNNIGVDDSFFDLASIRFKGRIRLREHFRCMPEIIQFSNNLCYQSEPLIPMKQIGGGRLNPVIATHHVADGFQQGSTGKMWNPPEAEAVVQKIQEFIKDKKYDGKSIGVISLLGDLHAKQIEKMLLEVVGPEEIEKRELVCGDSYAFQGDERDIMILSLVSAPTEGYSIGTLSRDKDARRFNVAASRAKEQMWLFHSATLNDLSKKCLRYQLLEYCQNPQIQRRSIDGIDISEIRELARNTDRVTSSPPTPFDSWFEVDVFFKIHDRGFRVIPQYQVAGRRMSDFILMRHPISSKCTTGAIAT